MEMGTATAWNMDGMGWDGERLLKKKKKGKGKGKSKPKGMANWREGKTMAVSQC